MAQKVNLSVDQGASYQTSVAVKDANDNVADLTGWTGAGQLRKHYSSSNSTSFGVAVDANSGIVMLSLTANQTGSLLGGRYVYDVELTDGANNILRIVEGIVSVNPQVTK